MLLIFNKLYYIRLWKIQEELRNNTVQYCYYSVVTRHYNIVISQIIL